jgi:hypothetical protein
MPPPRRRATKCSTGAGTTTRTTFIAGNNDRAANTGNKERGREENDEAPSEKPERCRDQARAHRRTLSVPKGLISRFLPHLGSGAGH